MTPGARCRPFCPKGCTRKVGAKVNGMKFLMKREINQSVTWPNAVVRKNSQMGRMKMHISISSKGIGMYRNTRKRLKPSPKSNWEENISAPCKEYCSNEYKKIEKEILETKKLIAEYKTAKLYIISESTTDAPAKEKKFRLEISNAEDSKKEIDLSEEALFRLLIKGMR